MCTHQNALTQGGYGIPKDEKRSFRFYEMAAQQGRDGAREGREEACVASVKSSRLSEYDVVGLLP